MREIKFRAWCPETKRMFKVDNIMWEDDRIVTIEGENEGGACTIWENEPYELMQYTGIKDKNGKEIYEGDVVEYKDYSNGALLSFSGKDVQPRSKHSVKIENMIHGQYFPGGGSKPKGLKVIGNVYENPEIIED